MDRKQDAGGGFLRPAALRVQKPFPSRDATRVDLLGTLSRLQDDFQTPKEHRRQNHGRRVRQTPALLDTQTPHDAVLVHPPMPRLRSQKLQSSPWTHQRNEIREIPTNRQDHNPPSRTQRFHVVQSTSCRNAFNADGRVHLGFEHFPAPTCSFQHLRLFYSC